MSTKIRIDLACDMAAHPTPGMRQAMAEVRDFPGKWMPMNLKK